MIKLYQRGTPAAAGRMRPRYSIHLLGLLFLGMLLCCEFALTIPLLHTPVAAFDHTASTLDESCNQAFYSPDGNPFQLCPGPYPGGGNCVWWAWEQWHLLGYNLPLNWGNAADWIVDAERTGLPLGTTPRVGSIAVFPVADGAWAAGTAGHVAFVTWVSADGSTFNVTYQNYGDPNPMYTGTGYAVSVINEPRYQDGELRFIYFPQPIDPTRFAHLPGVNGNGVSEVIQANNAMATSTSPASNQTPQVTLGLPRVSSEQAYNADFTGNGHSDLLLYTRAQGRLDILNLSDTPSLPRRRFPRLISDEMRADPHTWNTPPRISLADATTPLTGWGSSLDIRTGDFAGTGQSAILLYDRVTGHIQLLSLTPQLRIKQHIVLPGWGPGWEVYVGRLDGQRSALFLYNRSVNSASTASPTASSTPGSTTSPSPGPVRSPTASSRPSPSPSPIPGMTPSPSPGPSPTPTTSPSPGPSPSPTPSPTPSPSPTSTPCPAPSPTVNPSPGPTSSPTAGTGSHSMLNPEPSPSPAIASSDGGGSTASGPGTRSATANVLVLDFNPDLSIRHVQPYTLSQNSWEVYVGRFVNPSQDGIFLYDRTTGEARIMRF